MNAFLSEQYTALEGQRLLQGIRGRALATDQVNKDLQIEVGFALLDLVPRERKVRL